MYMEGTCLMGYFGGEPVRRGVDDMCPECVIMYMEGTCLMGYFGGEPVL